MSTHNLAAYSLKDEAACVEDLIAMLDWNEQIRDRVQDRARELVTKVRATKRKSGELESFLQKYGLDTEEGLALMTLAEALLRIPDAQTANALIRDKMAAAEWLSKQGDSKDMLVKAAGFGLSLTRKTLDSAISKLGEPMIRKAIVEAIRMLGRQFVLGRTIEEGVKNARTYHKRGYRVSYDMLGEGARTMKDADVFYQNYQDAIRYIAADKDSQGRASMSVKLSALYPRYEIWHKKEAVPFLTDRLLTLAQLAKDNQLDLTVDAEEVDRLDISLDIIEAVAMHPSLAGWDGFGLAVQAYQKRAPKLIEALAAIAENSARKIQVRLVKGAYWDTEIKRAQIEGLMDYPVYTRKANTDVCFLACAKALLERRDVFYPMLATHNAHSIAAIMEMAGNDRSGFEFQRLHGMGETLHDTVIKDSLATVSLYAPCGSHEELLPYLVRRLLENGASTSFVHQIMDESVPIETIIADPVEDAKAHPSKRHSKIPLPAHIYGAGRVNAVGHDLREENIFTDLLNDIGSAFAADTLSAAPMIGGQALRQGAPRDIYNPAKHDQKIGVVHDAQADMVDHAFEVARLGYRTWSQKATKSRSDTLERLGDLIEEHHVKLLMYCMFEAGKTLPDAQAELREAVDFCRYYAMRGAVDFAEDGTLLPGPTGERNVLTMQGRGVFVCISPWNFPLAIFTGQIAAALMAGNAVIAKPAPQTSLVAGFMCELIHQAGVPAEAFTLMPGGNDIGAALVAHKDVAGVAFTGSTKAARLINRALAAKDSAIVPLIAETGGQNAMIVDSSALPEQVIDDVLISAFGAAGQRCSALRILYLQDDIADKMIEMLQGAMAMRRVGDTRDIANDIGPVIDRAALSRLQAHEKWLEGNARFIARVPVSEDIMAHGTFFAPVAYEIDDIAQLGEEVFGPIVHVIRYKAKEIDDVIEAINATGYGLTLGVHSRISSAMDHITGAADVGNAYVNRTMIGAVVGVQPFGGNGLSGTGPKAGGPHYLPRFATEKVVSTDTTRQGGNATLVTLDE
jgi:RHH-type proline utilization regulon transcriptional repressor/proline dehydrogenase/delta 1-pyrroline-5-carboxylate dehydrogenase